jgi:hypothetical protein
MDGNDCKESKRLRYKVRLLIRHPSIDPVLITEELGLIPRMSALAGNARITPRGEPLPGLHKVSMWGYSFLVEGKRLFSEDLQKMIDVLQPHATFLAKITEDGGNIELIFHLPGDINIGDDISWRDLKRLSDLQIDLGIEVFPNFPP